MNISQGCSKDVAKQLEFVKQQQQLREIGFIKNNSNSKVLSADSMIEDLLSKKETFQKRIPELQQKQETIVPPWLSRTPPALFKQVWQGVQTAGGLADTPILSSVLLTSGLSTDTLGYIWSLANHTVPGALTQTEVYLVLALVGLAQAGYVVNNLDALHQVPQVPLPTLDLALLPTQKQVFPNTLNVANLPDSLSYKWTSDIANPSYSGQIGVSYVSSGSMMSPNLILDQINKSSVNTNIANTNVGDTLTVRNNTVSNNLKMNGGLISKNNSDTKHSDNAHCFSFPTLNDSPSHVTASQESTDLFDDEFTDFQSADFSSTSEIIGQTVTNLNSSIDNDEFTNFQNAPPNYNSDDLSVLVIGGKNIPSAQQLWVADNPSISHQKDKYNKIDKTRDLFSISSNVSDEHKPSRVNQSDINEEKNSLETKYESFQEIDDDKYSVFHNPLPDEEFKQNTLSSIEVENTQMETKSIFQHSLFEDPEPSLHPFQNVHKIQNFDLPNCQEDQLNTKIKENMKDDDDDEYSNFQDCPISFSNSSSAVSSQNVDKYDVFRTIVFEDTSFQEKVLQTTNATITENLPQVQSFESDMSEAKKENRFILSSNNSDTASLEFGDIQEPVIEQSSSNANIDSLFSSLVISDRNNEIDINSDTSFGLSPVEDKYKALRLLESSDVEVDDFGEFLGAELPNSGNEPRKLNNLTSVQIRCLEACLHLLKDGVRKLSQGSTTEVVSEVLNDSRTSAYLDCLLEVHRVSQRIINQLNCDSCVSLTVELCETWNSLAPYFKHSEHNPMVEVVGPVCGVCRSDTGPSPVTFGAQSFHTPCANLYLHCVEPVLPNKAATLVQ